MNGDRDEPFYKVFTQEEKFLDSYVPFLTSLSRQHGPQWTTWKWRTHPGEQPFEIKKTIDYIFVPPSTDLVAVAAPPATGSQALPSSEFSSDHVPVMAEFVLHL